MAGYQGIDPEGRNAVHDDERLSRSARVSSRSVALFVNAELRAGARVTGSSRKAPWGFMVPLQLGSEEAREKQRKKEVPEMEVVRT